MRLIQSISMKMKKKKYEQLVNDRDKNYFNIPKKNRRNKTKKKFK